MAHQSISSQNPTLSASALELRQLQDDEIRPAPSGLAAQVKPSGKSVVPYDFGQGKFSVNQPELARGLPGLASEVKKLQKMSPESDPLGYAQAHMVLEGKILNVMPNTSYTAVQKMLAQTYGLTHPALAGHEELKQLDEDLSNYLAKSGEQAKEGGGFKGIIDRHVARMGDTLGFCHSLYDNALEGASPEQQAAIKKSRQGFEGYAKGFMNEATEKLPDLLTKFFDSRIEHAKGIIASGGVGEFHLGAAKEELAKLEKAKTEFSLSGNAKEKDSKIPTLGDAIKTNDGLKTGLNNIDRENYVGALKEDRSSVSKKFKNATGLLLAKGIPQGGSSELHLGYARSAIDQHMQDIDANFPSRVFATAAVTGAAHKLVSDGIRPFMQLLMDQTIGLSTVKADALKTYPKALNVIAVDGARAKSSNLDAQNATQSKKREDYKRAQNANNFGTMSGDFTGFSAFGGANALRDLLEQFTEINGDSIHARALASAVGGLAMAGGQEVAKYLQTHGDENIPTHVLKRNEQDFKPALAATIKGAKTALDLTARATYNDLAGRVLSLAEGLALSAGVGEVTKLGLDASVREKMIHAIGSYFSSGLTLQPFFANNQAAPENKAIGGGKDDPAKRFNVPKANLSGGTAARTQAPKTGLGVLETGIHGARGASQVIPQGVIAGANIIANKVEEALADENPNDGEEMVAMEEGRAGKAKASPAGQVSK